MASPTGTSILQYSGADQKEKGALDHGDAPSVDIGREETRDVFQENVDGVEFRTVSWQRAAVVFLKINFAMSILAIPAALGALGSVGGSFCIIGYTSLNVYTGLILGDFKHNHVECHTLADMMGLIWGRWGREIVGVQIIVLQVLITAGGIVTTTIGFNALSGHGACTVYFGLVSAIAITLFSSIRTFSKLGWLTWFGFITFVIGVFIFVVAVTQVDRPAAAPKTGDFDLGWAPIAYPSFVVGMVNATNIFISTAGSSMFLPIISEMKRPQDYRKACLVAGFIVGAMYLSFSLVIYRYCGVWLSTPAFASAGPIIKKIAYGVSLPGLILGVGIYQHVAAKYAFVRILRDSKHLQANSFTHWATWLGINFTLGAAAFIVAEAIPIMNYLLGLAGAICVAPFSLVFPALLWMHDFKRYKTGTTLQKVKYGFHILIIIFGLYMLVAGVYSVGVLIKEAFDTAAIAKVFDCADNSGFVQDK
ncbi:transmembrane amino acid transporter protein-domain-containing protein [Fusarium venenatum]|uniref:transmembrane amino acid transporter protein-domain-containing protein n=1 Tax=Fusarium venenatum TaxID=56646 RepID=UPI001D99C153|nr:transmembrane amino acid transporter protein-domain-containing protein [Fusarium venenatum]